MPINRFCIQKKTGIVLFIVVLLVGILLLISFQLRSQKTTIQSKAAPAKSNSAIYGGTYVTDNTRWPFMVHITISEGFREGKCGGTLIDSQWVLTAYHCFEDIVGRRSKAVGEFEYIDLYDSEVEIVVGSTDLDSYDIHTYTVSQVIFPHIEKNYLYHNIHDIALLHIDSDDVERDPYINSVRTVSLKNNSQLYGPEGSMAVALGWGHTNRETTHILQQVVVPLLSNETVKTSPLDNYPHKDEYRGIDSSEFGFGFGMGHNNACNGDSGGPVLRWFENRWVQIGIMSWGGDPCYESHLPTVATRIIYSNDKIDHFNWIKHAVDTFSDYPKSRHFSYIGQGSFTGTKLPWEETTDYYKRICDPSEWSNNTLPTFCPILFQQGR